MFQENFKKNAICFGGGTMFFLTLLIILNSMSGETLAELSVNEQMSLSGGCHWHCNNNIIGCSEMIANRCTTTLDCDLGDDVCTDTTMRGGCAQFVGTGDQNCNWNPYHDCSPERHLNGDCSAGSGYCGVISVDVGDCGDQVRSCYTD